MPHAQGHGGVWEEAEAAWRGRKVVRGWHSAQVPLEPSVPSPSMCMSSPPAGPPGWVTHCHSTCGPPPRGEAPFFWSTADPPPGPGQGEQGQDSGKLARQRGSSDLSWGWGSVGSGPPHVVMRPISVAAGPERAVCFNDTWLGPMGPHYWWQLASLGVRIAISLQTPPRDTALGIRHVTRSLLQLRGLIIGPSEPPRAPCDMTVSEHPASSPRGQSLLPTPTPSLVPPATL